MRQFLKRFGIYLLILVALFAIFNLWQPLPPSGISGARLGYYVGLCVGFGIGALCFEFLASLKFRVLPLGNAMTVLISSSLINPVPTVPSHSF